MGNLRKFTGLAALTISLASFGPALQAQDSGQAAGPARAVRLSYVDGQVKLSQGNQILADQAVINTPLLEGMQLATADNGKAEIQFEDGSVVRIPPDSSLTLSALRGSGSAAEAELTLNGGLAYFELQGGYQNGKVLVHFGNSTATASGFTVMRITMDRAPGQVSVFSGNAHLDSANGAVELDLHDGESVALNGAQPDRYEMAESVEPDSWDAWNSDRDQVLTTEAAAQTGAPANMGMNQNPAWNDLDANGSWYNVPGQGYVWSPYGAANAGFDPYGYGNWMFTPGFGYIWASGYSWGYLPYQCGAWNFYDSFGWGWAPGLGGCSPWWGLGFYGGPNFGYLPPGYHVISRPVLPRHPGIGKPIPVLAVNRTSNHGTGTLPTRNVNTPVVIAGNSVKALTPLASRPELSHPTMMVMSSHAPSNTAGVANANGQSPSARPGYIRPEASGSVNWGERGLSSGRSTGSQSSHPSGGSAPHPASSAPSSGASHASSGSSGGGFSGGGGGGSHGGGGGGGGGGHR
ncbi:MAG: FecR family protein [Terracidiphilus sp.]